MPRPKVKLLTIPPGAAGVALVVIFFAWATLSQILTPAQAVIRLGFPLPGTIVVVDPGHGGIDSGVTSHQIEEKNIALAVSLELGRLLEQTGATAILTRSRDEDISHLLPEEADSRYRRDIKARVKIINESQAALFISIHIDSCIDPNIRGAIAFYNQKYPENKLLAASVQRQMNRITSLNVQPGEYIHQEIKEGSYYILNESQVPGIIIEIAFMTNPTDRELIVQPGYQKEVARALYMGILEYLYTHDLN